MYVCILLFQIQCTNRSLVEVANNSFTHDYCGYQPDDSIRCNLTAHNTAGSSAVQTVVKTKSCAGKLFCSKVLLLTLLTLLVLL